MGIFDFFKKKPKEDIISVQISESTKSLEQRNKEYLEMRKDEVDRLNRAYDFKSIDGIMSIPVPCQEVNDKESPTGRVEYYLRGKRFSECWESGEIEMALACLRKAQQLMYVSDMIWKRSDFMKLVSYLHKAGFHSEAKKEQDKVDRFFGSELDRLKEEQFERAVQSAKDLNTDLLLACESGVCCSSCACKRNRIYSISGRNKQFPKLDESAKKGCCLRLYPHVLGVSGFPLPDKDIVKHSNRPYADDRNEDEIARYNAWRKSMNEMEEKERRTALNQDEFFWIQENLPSICPKSLSGYSRMKNAGSKSFQEIVARAESMGYKIRTFDN